VWSYLFGETPARVKIVPEIVSDNIAFGIDSVAFGIKRGRSTAEDDREVLKEERDRYALYIYTYVITYIFICICITYKLMYRTT
jgi:hypothetical protein